MKHKNYEEAYTLIKAGIPVLLTGEAGSGKSTLIKQVAEDLGLRFFSLSMTRQTTLSHMLGFLSVNGTYVSSNLRDCFENGGLMLLDEIDAADPNALLCINTIENGYITFPDKLVKCHPDFRLAATSNPADQHNFYTARNKLDGASLDRFDIITIDRDPELEQSLVDYDTHNRMEVMRKALAKYNSSKLITMRDAVRYQHRKNLGQLNDSYIKRLADNSEGVLEIYNAQVANMSSRRNECECETFEELWDLIRPPAGEAFFDEIPTSKNY